MMIDETFSRRSMIGHAAGALSLGAAAAAVATAAPAAPGRIGTIDLADPMQRARARAKIIGSIRDERVYTLYRLNLYAFMGEGNLIPLITMNNLNIAHWQPLPNGHYRSLTAECGVYCRFDTDEVLEEWMNPITGETRPVWEFVGGPFSADVGPDGVALVGAELVPKALRMEILGDMMFVPAASGTSGPNPMKPAEWPTQSAGPTRYWDSQSTFAARVADVGNPDIASAPAFCHFQNLGTWHPWLGMGNRPGRTYGKAHGTKLASIDAIPPAVRAAIDRKTPEVFDFERWTAPRFELMEYMAKHRPS